MACLDSIKRGGRESCLTLPGKHVTAGYYIVSFLSLG